MYRDVSEKPIQIFGVENGMGRIAYRSPPGSGPGRLRVSVDGQGHEAMKQRLSLAGIDAFVFDMDGVVTDTAITHAAAWKRLFDEFLRERAGRTGERFLPFDADDDYRHYVDGKRRYDGVRDFLTSRRISLPEGEPSDAPELETVAGLGNRKDRYFRAHLSEHGARSFPSTVDFIGRLKAARVGVAVVSASRNMDEVLDAANLRGLFPVTVSGVDADRLGLRGKPYPDTFLEAARQLAVKAPQAAVVEDAIAGVEAGRRGGFRLVIGVDRAGHADALRAAGADVVVHDLGELDLAL